MRDDLSLHQALALYSCWSICQFIACDQMSIIALVCVCACVRACVRACVCVYSVMDVDCEGVGGMLMVLVSIHCLLTLLNYVVFAL